MKIKKEELLKVVMIVGSAGLLILMVVNYQQKQALIINDKQQEIAKELAISQENKTKAEKVSESVLYDLSLMGVDNFQPTGVAVSKTGRWGLLDENSQQMVIINGENKKFTKITPPLTAAKTSAFTWDDDILIVYAGGLYAYQENDVSWKKITGDLPEGKANLLGKFNLNYYLLGANSLQKIIFTTEGWQKTEAWLAAGTNSGSNPLDLWIDGSIYVSDQALGIRQFTRGELTNWKTNEEMEPPLYLAKNNEDFIVLAPKIKTVFRLNKKGEKIAAFTDERLADCQFIWLKENSFFTIKNNLIYNFNLP